MYESRRTLLYRVFAWLTFVGMGGTIYFIWDGVSPTGIVLGSLTLVAVCCALYFE